MKKPLKKPAPHFRMRKTSPVEPIALAARERVADAFDELLTEFIGRPAVQVAKRTSKKANQTELQRNYLRLRCAADALMRWHSDDAFLAKDGSPRPLRKTGKVSLEALAQVIHPSQSDAKALVDDLISFGMVVRKGNAFSPPMRAAVVGRPSPLILAHATAAILRLIGTVAHNVGRGTSPRYERHVAEVRIRSTDLPMFLRFVEQQGQYLIDSIDDWLSRREVKGVSREKLVAVGVGAFAWVEPPESIGARSTSKDEATAPRK